MVERHVLTRPEAVSLSYPEEGVTLTYAELGCRANRLAAYLIGQGVGPGDRVATCLLPGSDLVIAFLAIVRAGAAYVPMDPAHPLERRRLIVRDCDARVVVTTEAFAPDCAGLSAVTVAVDTLAKLIAAQSDGVPEVRSAPDDAAYVCYTSGTTGTPKGVVVPHRAVIDLVTSTDYVHLTPRDVVGQAANPAFDAVTFEIWAALTSGARVLGLSKDTVVSPAAFEREVREHAVSVLFLTTALFNQIARERPAAFAPLRVLLFGGEACDPRRVREVFAARPPRTLLHVYGPTETTTFATWHEVTEPSVGTRTVPIGRPIGTTVAYVLDAAGHRVPPGGTGELHLGGPCLALGYLGRPDLTRERFVDDPFAADGSKLYRTGDWVFVRPDGAIEFRRRVDDQIKLRGFRIELGEIESVLTSHPSVAQAVVSLHEAGDDRRLVAHVVPAASAAEREPSEQLTEWREIYETLYDDAESAALGSNFTGWNSSYDAEPIPLEQMEEWRASTVEAVRGLRPRRVLEIGVGTGLLLHRLAPDCEEYWGTDFSASVIDALYSQTVADPELRDKVTLSCRSADDIDGLPAGYFDTVVVNSVVQYFPHLDYLRTVLEGALTLLAPGGSLFLGDLRNLDLLRCMQTGVELAQGSDLDREGTRRAIGQRVAQETELLLSPALFSGLTADLPAIRSVDVRVKRGVHHNELTRYRYDAVLSTREPVCDLRTAPRLDWARQLDGVDRLAEYLRAERPTTLRVTAVPNGRIQAEYAAMRELDRAGTSAGTAEQPVRTGAAPDPEVLCAAGEGLGYRAFTTWSAQSDEALDVLFVSSADIPDGPLTGGYAMDTDEAPTAEDCANTPRAFDHTVDLGGVLHGYLQEQLPHYMVPAALVTLGELPLTPNGKVDRRALPAPVFAAAAAGTRPGTPVEEILRDLFAEVLGLPKREVYADSDFFAIGGHSLAAARLVARLRATLGADPSSRALYEAPTPALLAALLDGPGATAIDSAAHHPLTAVAAAPRAGAAAGESPRPTPVPVVVPQEQAPGHGTWETQIDVDLHRRLTAFAAEHGTTLFMLVHTALAAVLTRMGAGTDIVLATMVPARDDGPPRRAAPHTRMLALRTDTSGDPAFTTLLRRVREADLTAYRVRATPRIQPGGVILALAQEAGVALAPSGPDVQTERTLPPHLDAELALLLTERQSATGAPLGITVRSVFRRGAVDGATAASLTASLVALLASALDDSGSAISRLPLASDHASHRMRRDADGGHRTVAPATVPELFAHQTGHAPNAPALVSEGQEATYAELDSRSDRLARTLVGHKAGPGTAVAIAIASPVGFAVALLAVAKAGAVCLPLDPDAGAPQNADRLAKTRPVALLLDAHAAESLPPTPGIARLSEHTDVIPGSAAPLLDADRTGPLTAEHPILLAPAGAPGAGQALIGPLPVAAEAARRSEGLPSARSAWLVRRYPDADAALGLLGVLASGGTVLVPDTGWSNDLSALLDWLHERAAEEVLACDADAAGLCRAAGARGRGSARVRALTVSTSLDRASVDTTAFARAYGLALTVRGGPAEARLVTVRQPGGQTRTDPHHRVYVLDEALRPVAPGSTGALYLAGAGIALGYANRPAATGERFVPDPFAAPGSRMWRAASAAKRGSDGSLEVLGEPWPEDPFEDAYGTFTVLANGRGQRALWPTTAPVPGGWYEAHPEDLRETCLGHLDGHRAADLEIGS
ncbi:amino acid adenylation domain-containing protein [Streptomyces sp. NPDC059443]|uniref:amino acid adenylation domain-containing protein n=1 Tax=unclassified Streptomyces TaxID=2593676 RepID=UPI003676E35B